MHRSDRSSAHSVNLLASIEDEPAANGGPNGEGPLAVGKQVGRYVVLGQLGSGGMGAVYDAVDPDLGRRVAIKVLLESESAEVTDPKTAAQLGPSRDPPATHAPPAHAQFIREAKTLARVSHPNIISIFDVGLAEGQPFMAMERLVGIDLQAWLKARSKQLRGDFDWREFLNLALQAGRGLVAAHRAGLVHRDVKPANIFVHQDGRAIVLDFGLAQQDFSNQSHARPGLIDSNGSWRSCDSIEPGALPQPSIAGTPAYMAPEQHLGRPADARSDQFSFCALVYEGLYGIRPFAGKSREQIHAAIVCGEFQRGPRHSGAPTSMLRVLQRGLSAEAHLRYPSLDELLAALTQAVEAPKIRRRRGVLMTLGLAAAVFVGQQFEGDDHCRQRAQSLPKQWSQQLKSPAAAAFAAIDRDFARESWSKTAKLLDDYTEQWSESYRDLCANRSDDGSVQDQQHSAQLACLRHGAQSVHHFASALAHADKSLVTKAVQIARDLPRLASCENAGPWTRQRPQPNRPELRRQVRELRDRLDTFESLQTTGQQKQAAELLEQLRPELDRIAYRPALAELHMAFAASFAKRSNNAESILHLDAALQHAVASNYTALAAKADWQLILSIGYMGFDIARAKARLPLARARLERHGQDPQLEIFALRSEGILLNLQGRYEEALPRFVRQRDLAEAHEGRESSRYAEALSDISVTYGFMGRRKAQSELMRTEVNIRRRLLGDHHPSLATGYDALALAQLENGEYTIAARQLARGLNICEAAAEPGSLSCILSRVTAAAVAEQVGRYDRAEALLLGLDRAQREGGRRGHPFYNWALTDLAFLSLRRGNPELALERARKGLTRIENEAQVMPTVHANALAAVISAELAHGQLEQADLHHRELKAVLNRPGPMVATSNTWQFELSASLAEARKAWPQAIEFRQRALAESRRALGEGNANLAIAHLRLADALAHDGQLIRARTHAERALELKRAALGSDHAMLGKYYGLRATIDLREGAYERAIAGLRRQIELFDTRQQNPHLLDRPRFLLLQAELGDRGADSVHCEAAQRQLRRVSAHGPTAADLAREIRQWLVTQCRTQRR